MNGQQRASSYAPGKPLLHFKTSRCPPLAKATVVFSSHRYPSLLAHFSISMCPFLAASSHVDPSTGNPSSPILEGQDNCHGPRSSTSPRRSTDSPSSSRTPVPSGGRPRRRPGMSCSIRRPRRHQHAQRPEVAAGGRVLACPLVRRTSFTEEVPQGALLAK